MKHLRFILLTCACLAYSLVMAQTPFDSFSPETSRPMLVVEDEAAMRQQHHETLPDSMRYAVIVDIQQQAVYLADLSAEQILSIAPLTEEMRHWLSVDPLSDKYPNISPYAYCAWNTVNIVDPNGMVWTDVLGNEITDHSKIRAYIFYNPEEFSSQSFSMAIQLEMKYGLGTVALSSASTETEFAADWKAMGSPHIMEVDINHHGSNQAIHLDYKNGEYITSTGTGYTQSGRAEALNVSDLGTPSGNISNAQLNLNTCHSNSAGSWLGNIRLGIWRIPGTSATLKGSNETLMQSFIHYFDFYSVRGTSAGVSYNKKTLQPEPQFFFQSWTYYYKGGRK